jgi:hypothetical protein
VRVRETLLGDINIRARCVIIVITVLPGGGRGRRSVCTSFCNHGAPKHAPAEFDASIARVDTLADFFRAFPSTGIITHAYVIRR